jgi:hypothetical protein
MSEDLKAVNIVEYKYVPPDAVILIARAIHADEAFVDWMKSCVTVVRNVRMPKVLRSTTPQ